MKKSEEYLRSNKFNNPSYVTLEHAKTYGKIVFLECEIVRLKEVIKHKKTWKHLWENSL